MTVVSLFNMLEPCNPPSLCMLSSAAAIAAASAVQSDAKYNSESPPISHTKHHL